MNDGIHENDKSLIEDISTESRVLREARKLPMSPLTKTELGTVRRDFTNYLKKHDITLEYVSKATGHGVSTLSQFRQSKYKGDNDKVARSLNSWIERDASQRKAVLPTDFIRTKIVEEIQAVVSIADKSQSMAAIVAPSGSGKTMALEVMAEKYSGRLIYCTEDLTPKSLLVKIAKAVGGATKKKNTAWLMDEVVEQLRGTRRPLFLDEAHRLPPNTLPRIRSIHDQAQVAIIMAGTHEILHQINDRSDGRGQFASRCLQYNCLEHVHNAEDPDTNRLGRPLFTKDEIKQYLNNMQVRFAPDAIDMMWAISCLPNHGCLRTAKRIVMLLSQQSTEKAITRKQISRALALLFGGMGTHICDIANNHIKRYATAA